MAITETYCDVFQTLSKNCRGTGVHQLELVRRLLDMDVHEYELVEHAE